MMPSAVLDAGRAVVAAVSEQEGTGEFVGRDLFEHRVESRGDVGGLVPTAGSAIGVVFGAAGEVDFVQLHMIAELFEQAGLGERFPGDDGPGPHSAIVDEIHRCGVVPQHGNLAGEAAFDAAHIGGLNQDPS